MALPGQGGGSSWGQAWCGRQVLVAVTLQCRGSHGKCLKADLERNKAKLSTTPNTALLNLGMDNWVRIF